MKNYIKIFLLSVFAVTACAEVQTPEIPVASILMDVEELNISRGKSVMLSVTLLPQDATDRSIIWNSTKESVATVTPDGLVTAVGYGTSYIVATHQASSLRTACMITVRPYQVVVNSLEGEEIPQTVFGYPGMALQLEAVSTDTYEHTFTWTSSVSDCVSVQDGLLSWKNVFTSSEAPSGYLLYAESQIEVKSEDGTSVSFTAINNVLASFGLDDVPRQVGTGVKLEQLKSKTVQIYAKTDKGNVVISPSLYSIESTDTTILEVEKTSECWRIKSLTTNGVADVVLTIFGQKFTLTTLTVELYKDPFTGGSTEKFPIDDDIDWETEIPENQENQENIQS